MSLQPPEAHLHGKAAMLWVSVTGRDCQTDSNLFGSPALLWDVQEPPVCPPQLLPNARWVLLHSTAAHSAALPRAGRAGLHPELQLLPQHAV